MVIFVLSKFGIHFAFCASITFKQSVMNFLEAYLNDVDEFIQAEMGFPPLGAEGSSVGKARCCLPSNELHLSRGRILIISK